MSDGAPHLQVVPEVDAWALIDNVRGIAHPFCGCRAECLLRFALDPLAWPEDVDFWLDLQSILPFGRDVIGLHREGMKRPRFYGLQNIRLVRDTYADAGIGATWSTIDFWALAALLDLMMGRGLEDTRPPPFTIFDPQMDRAQTVAGVRLPLDRWIAEGRVRRMARWWKEPARICSSTVRAQMGFDYDFRVQDRLVVLPVKGAGL